MLIAWCDRQIDNGWDAYLDGQKTPIRTWIAYYIQKILGWR